MKKEQIKSTPTFGELAEKHLERKKIHSAKRKSYIERYIALTQFVFKVALYHDNTFTGLQSELSLCNIKSRNKDFAKDHHSKAKIPEWRIINMPFKECGSCDYYKENLCYNKRSPVHQMAYSNSKLINNLAPTLRTQTCSFYLYKGFKYKSVFSGIKCHVE